jgi:hypothetical protein
MQCPAIFVPQLKEEQAMRVRNAIAVAIVALAESGALAQQQETGRAGS